MNPSKLEDWEKKFDEIFAMDSNGGLFCELADEDGRTDYDCVKAFIRDLLKDDRERVLEEVIEAIRGEKVRDELEASIIGKQVRGYNQAVSDLEALIARLKGEK